MNKKELIQQTRTAFDFMQKLYLEISYLVKEIEGLLAEEEEHFIIGRPSGYSITNRSSSGLETNNVNFWLLRMLSVFFVAEDLTKFSGGVTSTRFVDGLKVIFMRIILDEKNLAEPFILIGVIYDIINIRDGKNPDKFEELIRHIEYRHTKVFSDDENIEYEDALIMFKGKFFRVNLYDLNTSDQIVDKVINPAVKLYRTI